MRELQSKCKRNSFYLSATPNRNSSNWLFWTVRLIVKRKAIGEELGSSDMKMSILFLVDFCLDLQLFYAMVNGGLGETTTTWFCTIIKPKISTLRKDRGFRSFKPILN